MRALFEKYKDFIMEVIHFGMVGVINTFLGWVIMAVLYNLMHMNYWLSSGISYFIGSVFSYHLQRGRQGQMAALAVCSQYYCVLSGVLQRSAAPCRMAS